VQLDMQRLIRTDIEHYGFQVELRSPQQAMLACMVGNTQKIDAGVSECHESHNSSPKYLTPSSNSYSSKLG
jgi:hypothetical protein